MATCSEDLAREIARRLGRDVEDLFEARQHVRINGKASDIVVSGAA
jgi:hypothetical protein